MNFIHCLSEPMRLYNNPSKDDVRFNPPVNMDVVLNMDKGETKGSESYTDAYSIVFRTEKDSVYWYFETATIRDDRLKEILEYVKSKGI